MARTSRDEPREDDTDDRSSPAVRKGGCASVVGCLLIVLVCGGAFFGWSQIKQKALDDLAAGDRLYAEGKKAEAVAKYKSGYSFAPDDKKPPRNMRPHPFRPWLEARRLRCLLPLQ